LPVVGDEGVAYEKELVDGAELSRSFAIPTEGPAEGSRAIKDTNHGTTPIGDGELSGRQTEDRSDVLELVLGVPFRANPEHGGGE
jgi:hypothetical protein